VPDGKYCTNSRLETCFWTDGSSSTKLLLNLPIAEHSAGLEKHEKIESNVDRTISPGLYVFKHWTVRRTNVIFHSITFDFPSFFQTILSSLCGWERSQLCRSYKYVSIYAKIFWPPVILIVHLILTLITLSLSSLVSHWSSEYHSFVQIFLLLIYYCHMYEYTLKSIVSCTRYRQSILHIENEGKWCRM